MKLSKDEIQKLVLSCILLLALVYVYFAIILGPLDSSQAAIQKEIADIQPKIESANAQIRRTRNLEVEANKVTDELSRIAGLIPVGAPIAWFPPRLVEFFEKQGIENPTIRLAGDGDILKLDDFKSLRWIVDLPKVSYKQLGMTMAAFENEEPLVRTDRLQIRTTSEDPEKQHVSLTVTNIVRNDK